MTRDIIIDDDSFVKEMEDVPDSLIAQSIYAYSTQLDQDVL